jgi:hypothetical protein
LGGTVFSDACALRFPVDHGTHLTARLSSFVALDPRTENGGSLGRKAFDPAQDLGEEGA